MWNPRPGGFHGKRDRCLCSMAYVDENDLVDDVSGVPDFVRSVGGMQEACVQRHLYEMINFFPSLYLS